MNHLKSALVLLSLTLTFNTATAQQPALQNDASTVKCRIAKRTFLRNPENNYYDVVYDVNDGAGEQILESRVVAEEAQALLADLVNAGKCSPVR